LRAVTTIAAADLAGAGGALAGRVLRIGEKWGVIRHAGGTKIVAWGDLRSKLAQATELTIAPTYRLRSALAGDVGIQAKP
ncbi:MAG: hypothetical protein HY721_31420, partial [Planctomycetes bacterium]|nr:hypothetical protein [Planctomycetota bacterium]